MAASDLARAQGGYDPLTYHAARAAGRLSEWLVGRKKRAELQQALASPLLALPQLYLHSKADPVSRPEWVREVMAGQRERGREVRARCWEDSTHVQHFLRHPGEYRAEVDQLLRRCGLAA